MNYLTVDRWLPFKLIVIAEAAWVLYFAGLVFWFQIAELNLVGSDGLRLGLILLAFHAVAPIGLITLMEHKHQHGVPVAPFVWILMAVFTDLWSVFDVWLHLAKVPSLAGSELEALKALSIIAIILSGLGSVWYIVLLLMGRNDRKNAKELSRSLDTDDFESGTEMKSYDRFNNLKAKAQVNLRQSILK
jgi:hypothetical protein